MGRENLPGRPLIYGTTKRFLEVFDLKDLSSLPKMKEIKAFDSEAYEPTPAGKAGLFDQETERETLQTESVQEFTGNPTEKEPHRVSEEEIHDTGSENESGEEPSETVPEQGTAN